MNDAADGGGSSDALELSPAVATTLVDAHLSASRRVTGLAGSVPNLDGGYADAALRDILGRVLGAADTLAMINEATGDIVRAVAGHLAGTDDEVAESFTTLSADPWPFGGPPAPEPSINPFGMLGGGVPR